jgi:hypothetical protein
MRWVDDVARNGQIIISSENLKGSDHRRDRGKDERIILEVNLKIIFSECGLYSSGSGRDPQAKSCERCNELSRSMKGFLTN